MSDAPATLPPLGATRLSGSAASDFAVIIPAYNEVANIPELVTELRATFERHGLGGEVIIVDDGSTDGTAAAAAHAAEAWPQLRVVGHRRNFGKTEAMLTGAEHTDRQWLILFDADLQHSPEEIPRYLEKLAEGWDIVTGRKVGAYEKRFVSSTYNRLSRHIFRLPVSDTNSMKGFRRQILDEVHLRHDWHRFFVVLAFARGYSATELDIALHPRRHGEAKYSGKSRIVVGLLDLLSVWFFLFFSRKPMLLFGVSGLLLAVLGFLTGLAAIGMRLAGHGFRPLLYLVILLEVLGFLLFGFGFIAELVAQQHAELESFTRRMARPQTGSGGPGA
ncbi:MAG: glycosyltransferase family 2 protein [Gemmatimonadetes bacterium]|nr:glycosyltransferase family 2 protein [Gemmatimonadota bacterium]